MQARALAAHIQIRGFYFVRVMNLYSEFLFLLNGMILDATFAQAGQFRRGCIFVFSDEGIFEQIFLVVFLFLLFRLFILCPFSFSNTFIKHILSFSSFSLFSS